MVHLPAPPRFTLPPPPMPPSELFDATYLAELTCSSIRQQGQQKHQQHRHEESFQANPRLILISSALFLLIAVLFTILVIMIQYYRQRKSLVQSLKSQASTSVGTISSDHSLSTSRSYETISSRQTGVYLESINTSATTYSTDPSHTVCLHCQHDHAGSVIVPAPVPPYYHTLDLLPS